jgi:type II secretory pathway component PulF
LAADLDLRRKIKGALLYPVIVVFAIVALGTTLAVYVMPNLIRLFTSIEVRLPLSTRLLLASGTWLAHYWLWTLVGALLLGIGLRLLVRVSIVEAVWHRVLLHLPVVGPITKQINLSRLGSTFGSLLKSGVPIAEALQAVMHSSTNHVYRQNLQQALHHIEQGGNLASFLEHHPALYPALLSRMVAVGERTAQLDAMLLYVGQYYEQEVDASTKQLGVILEPVLLVAIAVVVVFVGLSVIQPIYQFTASIGRI